jgi:hypothetical protein
MRLDRVKPGSRFIRRNGHTTDPNLRKVVQRAALIKRAKVA